MLSKTVDRSINMMPLVKLIAGANKPCDYPQMRQLMTEYAVAIRNGRPFSITDVRALLDPPPQALQPRRNK